MRGQNPGYLIQFSRLILMGALLFCGCIPKAPIRLGLAAELTGKQAELGIHLRNGVELAVEEINAGGGIGGRKVELLVEDDFGTPQGARDAENKLIDAGVTAVIGHVTSDQTLAGYTVNQTRGVLLLSATASTSVMSGKKDLFFRTVASTDAMGRGLAAHIRQQRGLMRMAIIYDQDNDTYAEPLQQAFSDSFTSLGGEVTRVVKFSGAASPDFAPLVESLKPSDPEGILIIAAPANTAMIAQTIRLADWAAILFTSSWGQGEAMFQNGGKAVEGMETIMAFDTNDPSPELTQFKAAYQKRFAIDPIFTAMESYETMLLLSAALQKTNGKAQGLAEALTGVENFQGLTGQLRLDNYGDALRPLVIQKASEGKFLTIEKLYPAP
jgi:branched-chain amino acid transport system substrate-binding protein